MVPPRLDDSVVCRRLVPEQKALSSHLLPMAERDSLDGKPSLILHIGFTTLEVHRQRMVDTLQGSSVMNSAEITAAIGR
jgi:hypothetical protein